MEEPELTTEERKAIRELLEADRRAKWLVNRIKHLFIWLSVVIGGFALVYDSAVKILRKMIL